MPAGEGLIRTRRELRSAVREFERSLGDSAESVRAHLAAAGVRGTPRDSGSCPIARYFQAVIGSESRVARVSVHVHSMTVVCEGRRRRIRVRNPVAVASFIWAFDSGRYPDLVHRPRGSSSRLVAVIADQAADERPGV